MSNPSPLVILLESIINTVRFNPLIEQRKQLVKKIWERDEAEEHFRNITPELTIAQATIFNAITGRPPVTTPVSRFQGIWNSIRGQDTEEQDMMRTLAAYVILNEKDSAKAIDSEKTLTADDTSRKD